jgi:acid phosphatase family membrane protein YuiD
MFQLVSVHGLCVFILDSGLKCRGFADSIFGMSVVFASIVMYDAQVWLFCLSCLY